MQVRYKELANRDLPYYQKSYGVYWNRGCKSGVHSRDYNKIPIGGSLRRTYQDCYSVYRPEYRMYHGNWMLHKAYIDVLLFQKEFEV